MTAEARKVPSIRQLATALDVDPMAIYHYFLNKREMLAAVAASILETIYQPKHGTSWKRELSKLAVSYVEVLREYPGLLETMLSTPTVAPVQVFSDRFDTAISSLNIDDRTRTDTLNLMVDYLHGFAFAANCLGEQTHLLKTKDVAKPMRLLFLALEQV